MIYFKQANHRSNCQWIVLIVFLLFAHYSYAQAETQVIDWFSLVMGLCGGLALFLFGMEQMSAGLKGATGESLKTVLARLTQNRVMGAFTGAFVTAVLNSSSVTTVLVVGFISSGLMSLTQSAGVIMGANIGSTFTAQIIAFNITQYALIGVAVGFYFLMSGKNDKPRLYGSMIMGLGLVFYGMGVMGEAMTPLRAYQPFIELMARMEAPLLGLLIGAVFTGLVQSSAATTGIAIVMATEGLITLPAGIALTLGANIGTCITAILAAIGKPTDALRAATIHVLFNIAGVLIWILFIPQLAEFVVALSPTFTELQGKERLAAEVPRQIANAHTIFNVANTILFLGFTPLFAKLAMRLVPDKPLPTTKVLIQPKFLDEELLNVPSLALERVRFEIGHMGEIINDMNSAVGRAFLRRSQTQFDAIAKMDDKVDLLNQAILSYLSKIHHEQLTASQNRSFQALISTAINLESLADIIKTDLPAIGRRFLKQDFYASHRTSVLLESLATSVAKAFDGAITAVRDNDEKSAAEVIALKEDIRRKADDALRHQSSRISVKGEGRIELVRLEMELIDKLRSIYTLAKRIAKEFAAADKKDSQ